MNKWILSCLPGLLLFSFSACADSSVIDKLVQRFDPKINLGMQVLDLNNNKILYQRNADTLFIPASNMKLFSDAAALLLLGPNYQFTNQLSLQAKQLQKDTLQGNIVLHLPGDPSFNQTQLSELFQALSTLPVHTINGDILIDSPLARFRPHPPGWMKEDSDYGYGAPLSPLMLDQNRVHVTVNPAGRVGEAAIIEEDTPYGLSIINQVKTVRKNKHCGLAFKMDANNRLTVRGCVRQGQWAVIQQLALKNSLRHAQNSIQNLLKQQGISHNGKIRLANSTQPGLLLARSESPRLSQLISETMKTSDNLYADSLYLHTALQLQPAVHTWADAQKAIKAFLHQEIGLDLKKAILTDGSGLSRHNLLSPAQTTTLLRFLHQHFALTYEYVAALPVAGRDGTLQKRLGLPRQMDRVRAKTGTMRGVVSLSGYMDTKNGHTLAFAMYVNNLPGTRLKPARGYRRMMDAICEYFLLQSPTKGKPIVQSLTHSPLRFQGQISQAAKLRQDAARWRQLETQVKRLAQRHQLTILFRPNALIIQDNQKKPDRVFAGLQQLHARYPFAVILQSQTQTSLEASFPLLWQKTAGDKNMPRVWILRPEVTA